MASDFSRSLEEAERYVEQMLQEVEEEIYRKAGLEPPPETTEPNSDDSVMEEYDGADTAILPLSSVTPDFDKGMMMVGDTPMTEFFAQNASPQTPDQAVELDPAAIAQTQPDNTTTAPGLA